MTAHKKAVEAAERAGVAEQGCGYNVDGKQVLCCDPVMDAHLDPYGKPMRREHCDCREAARAAISAYLASMREQGWVMVEQSASLAPPSSELGEPKKAFADTFSAQAAMLAAQGG